MEWILKKCRCIKKPICKHPSFWKLGFRSLSHGFPATCPSPPAETGWHPGRRGAACPRPPARTPRHPRPLEEHLSAEALSLPRGLTMASLITGPGQGSFGRLPRPGPGRCQYPPLLTPLHLFLQHKMENRTPASFSQHGVLLGTGVRLASDCGDLLSPGPAFSLSSELPEYTTSGARLWPGT